MVEQPGFLPTPAHEDVLRAALLPDERAVLAWERWRRAVRLEDVDRASFRLLPLAWRNLHARLPDDPAMPRLKGVYRQSHFRNELLAHRAAALLAAFRAHGIDTMALKGLSLAARHYRDPGARAMTDADLLVRPSAARAAVEVVASLGGWTSTSRVRLAEPDMWHAAGFRDAAGLEVDVHWHALYQACFDGADDELWEAAVPFEVHGVPTRAPCATDQLLAVCVHGARWNALHPCRWVADAWVILAQPPEPVDWDRLVRLARSLRVVPFALATLEYLAGTFGAPVPAAVLGDLARTPVSRPERWYFARACRQQRGWNLPAYMALDYWVRIGRHRGVLRGPAGFPGYLRATHDLGSWRELAWFLATKTARRLFR